MNNANELVICKNNKSILILLSNIANSRQNKRNIISFIIVTLLFKRRLI